ncbi:hypothetical protein [Streptosporangium longisporum]|uniref:hypothetical protein n=1 Tax=Streptosporangium longisporum TaxID=46187 RepID=UPI0031E5DF56
MSVPFWNVGDVGGGVPGGRPGHLRDRDGVGEVGCRVTRARAGLPERRAGHGRSIAA